VGWTDIHADLNRFSSVLPGDQIEGFQSVLTRLTQLQSSQEERNEQVLALSLLAKMLIHSPSASEDRLAWQTLIRDFETQFLSERLLFAYDLMHQGLEAREALAQAEKQIEFE
jgi:hypothetical protein